jgi:hypothetical protein
MLPNIFWYRSAFSSADMVVRASVASASITVESSTPFSDTAAMKVRTRCS